MNQIELFISYASEDYKHAKRLFYSLRDMEEMSIWMDKETILPGDHWREDLFSAIERSRFFIAVISPVWVRKVRKEGVLKDELTKACDCLAASPGMVTIIPTRVKRCRVEIEETREFQYIDLYADWAGGIRRIRRTIREKIESDLTAAFHSLRLGHLSERGFAEKWCEEYEPYLLKLPSSVVIDSIDKTYEVYADQLYATTVMARMAAARQSAVLGEYVIRTFEIARLCSYDRKVPEFYGFVLHAAYLLPKRMRSHFLRDVFTYYVEHLAGVHSESWWADFAFRDVAKHYMSVEDAEQLAGFTGAGPVREKIRVDFRVASRCVERMRWDIPLIDLLIFYSRRSGDVKPLYTALDVLRESIRRHEVWSPDRRRLDVSIAPPEQHKRFIEEYRFGAGFHFWQDLPNSDMSEMKWADERENYHRIGLLYRIATYMKEFNPEYAFDLEKQTLSSLKQEAPKVEGNLTRLSETDKRCLLEAVEVHDEATIRLYIKNKETREKIRELVPWGTSCEAPTTGEHLPVGLPTGIFKDYPEVDASKIEELRRRFGN